MKNKTRMSKKSAIITPIVILAVSACLAQHTPPATQHTSMTPTQSQHRLTGLNIIYSAAETIRSSLAQTLTLTVSKVEYHIDGRLVASGLESMKMKTFVQLPPGEHELVYQFTARGLMSLGMKIRGPKHTYRFILAENQIGDFVHHSLTPGGAKFENVKFSKEIKP